MLTLKKRKKRMIYLLFLSFFVIASVLQTMATALPVCAAGRSAGIGYLLEPEMKAQREIFEEKEAVAQTDENNEVSGGAEEAKNVATSQLPFELSSPSAVLMEGSTGQVIFQKDADTKRSPASITKIMTLLLIFDELKSGRLKLTDQVTTSAYAKSMGGSQVFLEEGEVQSVETLIKCIVIASGNDASVAMAEHIAGSEEAFVERMNEKAQSLGMKNTHFMDCCGLSDDKEHYTSALDVAIMSRALIVQYPEIEKYTTIWMEDIVHTTGKGSSEFTLSSTNKLLKQYEYATGLKTGSTSAAKYCFSGTARKNGINLIAVVMACPDSKERFKEARKMLEYGFSIASVFEDKNEDALKPMRVEGGKEESVGIEYKEPFRYLDLSGNDLQNVEKRLEAEEPLTAPVEKGQVVGRAVYLLGEKELGSVELIAKDAVEKARFIDVFKKVLLGMLL